MRVASVKPFKTYTEPERERERETPRHGYTYVLTLHQVVFVCACCVSSCTRRLLLSRIIWNLSGDETNTGVDGRLSQAAGWLYVAVQSPPHTCMCIVVCGENGSGGYWVCVWFSSFESPHSHMQHVTHQTNTHSPTYTLQYATRKHLWLHKTILANNSNLMCWPIFWR